MRRYCRRVTWRKRSWLLVDITCAALPGGLFLFYSRIVIAHVICNLRRCFTCFIHKPCCLSISIRCLSPYLLIVHSQHRFANECPFNNRELYLMPKNWGLMTYEPGSGGLWPRSTMVYRLCAWIRRNELCYRCIRGILPGKSHGRVGSVLPSRGG